MNYLEAVKDGYRIIGQSWNSGGSCMLPLAISSLFHPRLHRKFPNVSNSKDFVMIASVSPLVVCYYEYIIYWDSPCRKTWESLMVKYLIPLKGKLEAV